MPPSTGTGSTAAGGTFESDTGGTYQSDTPGTFQTVTDGTFHSAMTGTFQSDTGGTSIPLLSPTQPGRSLHLPGEAGRGRSGGHSRARCGGGRNQAFFVLMAGAGLVGEAPCARKILRRTAVQRGLDRFRHARLDRASMGGKGASATGWDKWSRAATCSLPGDTAFWVSGWSRKRG